MNLNTNQAKKKKMSLSLLLSVVAALALAPSLSAIYQAEAASNKQISGTGAGTAFCPTTPFTSFTASIFFSASKNKGTVSGNWQISGSGIVKGGSINSGSIGENSFSLSGTENFGFCPAIQPTPVTATIRGECGTGAEIIFEAANGERGTFTGNVACS
jgi:hypothetical protein